MTIHKKYGFKSFRDLLVALSDEDQASHHSVFLGKERRDNATQEAIDDEIKANGVTLTPEQEKQINNDCNLYSYNFILDYNSAVRQVFEECLYLLDKAAGTEPEDPLEHDPIQSMSESIEQLRKDMAYLKKMKNKRVWGK